MKKVLLGRRTVGAISATMGGGVRIIFRKIRQQAHAFSCAMWMLAPDGDYGLNFLIIFMHLGGGMRNKSRFSWFNFKCYTNA